MVLVILYSQLENVRSYNTTIEDSKKDMTESDQEETCMACMNTDGLNRTNKKPSSHNIWH